jgi:hypothetical protein
MCRWASRTGKLLIVLVALAACGDNKNCIVDCAGQGVLFSLPSVPASTSTVRLCISELCSAPRAIDERRLFESNPTGVSFKDNDRVPVRVDALDERGNIVATVAGVATTEAPKSRCRGWQSCIAGTVVVDEAFTTLRDSA